MNTRKEFIKSGLGLAGIIAMQKAPAFTKSLLGARYTSLDEEQDDGLDWCPYAHKGLVAMWDGEWNVAPGEHNSTSTTWIDLVHGYELKLCSKTTFGENCTKRPKGDNQYAHAIGTGVFLDSYKAIEIVCKRYYRSSPLTANLFICPSRICCFSFESNEIRFGSGAVNPNGGCYKITINDELVHSFSRK